ncbi:HDOD domain-containing protein, partial [Pseudomonas syringae group genomosp. 7]|uniref:HDOD domain-containing protein n=1 Tax=Pseudomonas syringae group genomosp. 7 TaxID=251699 RepID=UPI0037707538
VDESYALGLFHDCGIPLKLKRFPNYMTVLEDAYANAGPDCRVDDTENNAFDTNQSVVGYYTAKSRRMPANVTDQNANQ